MAGDDVVDFKPIFDGADAIFEAFRGCHDLLPSNNWRMVSSSSL
jgi:hypothetical protein